jgi:hypothetical protein
MKIHRPHIGASQNNRTRNRVRKIVMRARTVINAVPAPASRPTLQTMKLGNKSPIVEKLNPPAVQ